MSGSREDLFANFSVLSYEMNRLFSQLLKCKTPPRMSCQQSWCPPCDVYETPRNITVRLEIPGINRKDVEIRFESNALHIRGKRREARTAVKTNYYQMEIHYGAFERVVPLPTAQAGGKIKTTCANGFIEIIVPKKK